MDDRDLQHELSKIQNTIQEEVFNQLVELIDQMVTAIDHACLHAYLDQDDPEKLVTTLAFIQKLCEHGKDLVAGLKGDGCLG